MRKTWELAGMAFMAGVYAVVFVFEFPARMVLDSYYGWRKGSGLQLEPHPLWTESKFRLMQWALVTIIVYLVGMVLARLMPDNEVWLTNPWLVTGAGLFASLQWLGVMSISKPTTFLTDTGERYLLKVRTLTVDALLFEVIRQGADQPDRRITFSNLCETPDVLQTKIVDAGQNFVDLQSLFSKKAFSYPDDSYQTDEFTRDYCRGILRIRFLDDNISVGMPRWFSIDEELEKATELHQVQLS